MKEKSIFGSVKIVIFTLIAVKLIGFVKQAVIAAYFGTSGTVDKFLLVSELMDNLGVAIFSAITITFLTIYVETFISRGRDESSKLTSNVVCICTPFIIIIVLLLIIFSNQIAYVVAPGYLGEDHQLVSVYIKMFSITVINMFIYYICNAVLEAEKNFFPGKVVGVIRSVCVVGAIVFLSGRLGINSMYIGVITYFILESAFLLFCVRKKIKFKPEKPFQDKRIRNLFKLSLPLFVSYGVLQIQGIVDKAIASGLTAGSIATLSYSGYLYNTTHSILVGGLCTVIFSFFTTYVAEKKDELLLKTLYKYLRISVIILLFVTVVFIGFSTEIISIIYERGAFGEESVKNVAIAFCAYSSGLVFIGIRDIMIRTHYAYQSNGQAMINGIVGVAVNVVMSIILSRFFGFVGIAFATSFASVCIAVLSCQTIKKKIPEFRVHTMALFFIKVIFANAVTIGGIYLMNHFFSFGPMFVTLCIKGIISMAVYLLVLRLLKCDEVLDIKDMVLNKLKHR